MVAGDAAYNDVHLYLAESNPQTRREWIAALDKIESLKPRAVIASHKRPDNDDNPTIIEETRQYIRDFDRLADDDDRSRALREDAGAYPNRVNPGWALWSRHVRSSHESGSRCLGKERNSSGDRCRWWSSVGDQLWDSGGPLDSERGVSGREARVTLSKRAPSTTRTSLRSFESAVYRLVAEPANPNCDTDCDRPLNLR